MVREETRQSASSTAMMLVIHPRGRSLLNHFCASRIPRSQGQTTAFIPNLVQATFVCFHTLIATRFLTAFCRGFDEFANMVCETRITKARMEWCATLSQHLLQDWGVQSEMATCTIDVGFLECVISEHFPTLSALDVTIVHGFAQQTGASGTSKQT